MGKKNKTVREKTVHAETTQNVDEQKSEFLYFTLEALDNRRNAIDSRTNVILLLSTTVIVFFASQLSEGSFFYPKNLVLLINAIVIAAEAIFSCIYSLLLISPLTRKRKDRKNPQKSLSWFYIIADMSPENYEKNINKMNNGGFTKELSLQIVLISRLLKKRYLRMKTACIIQYIVLCHLFLYSAAVLLFTYLTPTVITTTIQP